MRPARFGVERTGVNRPAAANALDTLTASEADNGSYPAVIAEGRIAEVYERMVEAFKHPVIVNILMKVSSFSSMGGTGRQKISLKGSRIKFLGCVFARTLSEASLQSSRFC